MQLSSKRQLQSEENGFSISTRKERKCSVSFNENEPQFNMATEMELECNVKERAHLSQFAKPNEDDTDETSFLNISNFGR